MVATNMFCVDPTTASGMATYQNPRSLMEFRPSVVVNAAASLLCVHNFNRCQTQAFTVNHLLVFIDARGAGGGELLIRKQHVSFAHVDNNGLRVFNNSGSNLTLRIKVIAVHSAPR